MAPLFSLIPGLFTPWLPGRILPALVCPFVTAFVVDLSFGEQPLAILFDEFIPVVCESVKDSFAVRIVVGEVKPVGI